MGAQCSIYRTLTTLSVTHTHTHTHTYIHTPKLHCDTHPYNTHTHARTHAHRGGGLGSHQVSLVLLHQVHLVDQAEDLGVGGVLQDGLQAGLVVVHVLLQLPALHVEHIDQHLHVPEDVVPLAGEVVLHERVLAGGRHRYMLQMLHVICGIYIMNTVLVLYGAAQAGRIHICTCYLCYICCINIIFELVLYEVLLSGSRHVYMWYLYHGDELVLYEAVKVKHHPRYQ